MHKQNLAPVALFVYNRPWHTSQTLEALKRNALAAETVLYIFADGKKETSSPEDSANIQATREIIRNLSGFKKVIVLEKDRNQGLAQSIVSGVTEVVNNHGKIIVLEDDLVVSPFFLEFMNQGLDAYQDSANVYSVNGFMFPVKSKLRQTVLLPYTSTWGWATWKDKWSVFDSEMKGKEFLTKNPYMTSKFNLGDYKYTDMLNYGNNSWGIKWYFSVFKRNGLNVFPTQSLVNNIGFDGSGENCTPDEIHGKIAMAPKMELRLETEIDLEFYHTFVNYFSNKKSRRSRVLKLFYLSK
jgi:hypothetical protein